MPGWHWVEFALAVAVTALFMSDVLTVQDADESAAK